eukprot:TRINITY_DN10220_c0_g2_i6.p1 TRINITY_DN10220_c0_g2~~TRINITY_DN10220_c0_g2_i6.p1  ORF type:complete len:289 (+),score=55.63 TRINITY_DN10220_c0_g2_i6:243-1109(+)
MAGFAKSRETLRKLRRDEMRSSQKVVECVDELLKDRSKLGDEVWAVLEQDAMAALDLNLLSRAEGDIASLRDRFGDSSVRISVLEGMLSEARMEWDEAIKLYEGIIEANPGHQAAMKRIVAIAKGQGNTEQAVALLKDYLEIHQTDQSAWIELATLYVASSEFKFAGFCYEDLILLQPFNYVYHLKYAEVLYTQGSNEAMELAKKEFMQSFELKPEENMRALYGVCLCVSTLGAGSYSRHAAAHIKQDLMQEFEWAMGELQKLYNIKNPNLWPYVETSLLELKNAIKL